jgi:hypothetical protein
MSKVNLTSELPIPAEMAAALARNPEMMKYLLRPVLRAYRLDVPERIEVGTHGSARLGWFPHGPTTSPSSSSNPPRSTPTSTVVP